MVLKNVVT